MKLVGPVLAGVAVALATHFGVLAALPSLIMREILRVAAAQAGGANAMAFPARVTDATQPIVRASPDVFYATCVFDLAAGPVMIASPSVPGTHSVVALFADNTDNFFVAGDWRGESLALVIARDGARPPTGLPVVSSPSIKGLALVRVLVGDERDADAIDAARRSAICGRLAPSGVR
jgi:uncharacterized membrane protein